jgi:hypothetical protein
MVPMQKRGKKMSTYIFKLELTEEVYNTLNYRFEGKIERHLEQLLSDIAQKPNIILDKRFFKDFEYYLDRKEKALDHWPRELRNQMIVTLKEMAPTERWVQIKDITACFNRKLELIGRGIKPYGFRSVGSMLSALGFVRRTKPGVARKVLIEQEILQRYLAHVKDN